MYKNMKSKTFYQLTFHAKRFHFATFWSISLSEYHEYRVSELNGCINPLLLQPLDATIWSHQREPGSREKVRIWWSAVTALERRGTSHVKMRSGLVNTVTVQQKTASTSEEHQRMQTSFNEVFTYDVHHEKMDLEVFVVVIPKEGWVRPRPPILLLVWHQLFENII